MKMFFTDERLAKCADWYIPVSELFEKDDDCSIAPSRHVAQWNTESGYCESRDRNGDKSRVWNVSKNAGISRIGVKIVRGNELKSRDRNDGKSRDRNGGKSRDRSITRTLDYKGESDNPQNAGVAKSRDRNVTKSRDRRDGCTTQETTQQTTQDYPKKRRENNGEKRSDKSKHVIVALIKRFPKIRQTEMAKATGLSVKGVEKVLAQLKAANVIARVGGKRFGQWQICKQESNT